MADVMLKFAILTTLFTVAISETTEDFICRSVRNGGFAVGTVNSTRGAQGPPGERGVPGIPGGQGPPGSPGSVDYEKIYEMIDEKIRQGLKSIRSELEELRRNLTGFSTINETKASKNVAENSTDSKSQICKEENGLAFDGKCYYADLLETTNLNLINYEQAVQRCNERNSLIAELHSLAHQRAIQDFVRSRLTSPINLWLGMTYQSSKKIVGFRSGKEVSADLFKWIISYPDESSDRIVILIRNDGEDVIYEGIFNRPSSKHYVQGVICEKPL